MRLEIDVTKFARPPRPWQPEGVDWIVNGSPIWPNPKNVAVFDDVGMGKTYQCINAAQILYKAGIIDIAVVVAPARVRAEWDDQRTGMIHMDMTEDYSVCRIDSRHPEICKPREKYLQWFILSYPYIRMENARNRLMSGLMGKKYAVFFDESSHIKNRAASQTKGARQLSDYATRVVIINGTPTPNDIMDLWSQFRILDPRSVQGMSYYQFRNKYALMGGYMGKNVVGVKNGDEMREMFKPWVLRRERAKTPGVEPKTYSIIPVEMPNSLYEMYTSMRKEMIAWLGSEMAVASQAGVRSLRLSQLTSGFLGGIVDFECVKCSYPEEQHGSVEEACDEFVGRKVPPREVDDTKTNAVLEWIDDNPGRKVVICCRFTAEIERLYQRMTAKKLKVSLLYGGVSGKEGEKHLSAFKLGYTNYLIMQPQAGSEGLNLQMADVMIFLSNDYNWKTRYQAEGRLRPSVEHRCLYVDIMMSTPGGKKTVDSAIIKKLRSKEEMSRWTVETWKRELLQEE